MAETSLLSRIYYKYPVSLQITNFRQFSNGRSGCKQSNLGFTRPLLRYVHFTPAWSHCDIDVLNTCSCERKLKTLCCDMNEQVVESSSNDYSTSELSKRKKTLDSLESYFDKMEPDERNHTRAKYQENTSTEDTTFIKPLIIANDEADRMASNTENTGNLQIEDEASNFYLISLLVGVNIAVFLFEIASPIRVSDVESLSLPAMYGAKVNKLILVGEWWRLLTPMFLHSGFPHVALSSWVLLTFGPQVCRGYGPFTFLLLYLLGGICGNLISFFHTPELTVCGTGPAFAIIGAWLVYQMQNKQVVSNELSESMFRKAVAATAFSFLLSNFGSIDDWTHLGAIFSGITFGYLTCPTLQILDSTLSSENSRNQESVSTLVRRQVDPCKSLLVFAVSILVLSCVVSLFGPQLELLEIEDL